ncbi:MAG: asparaginyl/glutamyl-tRNA amidotransferase subunit C [Omnitrophica bacterium RIFCSPLOWO2_12_FULL_50_11]|nr:MAG: asparaginyl/glutamyl-tRNA amidotransferase subunit C [Omnitrophica bacterium RIFCSPLOWO2_12_FULL_50_11]
MSDKVNIDQIAELARLNLKPEERLALSKDLDEILAYVDQLQELNTDQVEPTSHPLALENVFRQDSVAKCDVGDRVLEHAPKREEKYFKVPKVIEGQS